jgi:hypothetical protein
MPEQRILLGDEPFLRVLRGKQLSRGVITSLLSLSDSEFWQISKRLIDLGYVYKPEYGVYALTDKGNAYIERHYLTMRPTFGSKEVQTLIQKIPTEAHQSFFRLLLSGYVAKLKFFDLKDEEGNYRYGENNSGFLIGGPTTSFKTNTARLVCRVLGLTPEEAQDCIKDVATALPKELWVRRVHRKGEERPIAIPGLILSYLFLCLDDWRKGNLDVRRSVMRFLDGVNRRTIEGVRVEIHPCPLITTNLNPMSKELDIPEDRIRRSVIVNTEGLGKTWRQYEEAADDIFNGHIPIIETDSMLTPFHTLEADERALIKEILYEGVGEDRKVAVFDSQSVLILVLGWLILTQGKNPKQAIFEVCYDKLITLETLGLTVEGWRDLYLARYGKYKGEIDPDFERKRLEIEKRKEEIKVTIEEGKEKIEERQHSKEEIRRDLIRAYVKVNTDYKLLIKDLNEATKFMPEIETGGLLGYIRDDRDQFKSGKKTEDRLERYQRVFNEDKEAADPYLARAKQKGSDIQLDKKSKKEGKEQTRKDNTKARNEAIQGMRDLKSDCIQQNQWRAAQTTISDAKQWQASLPKKKNVTRVVMDLAEGHAKNVITAITKLREVTKRVCSKLTIRINHPGGYSTPELEYDLESLTVEVNPWIEEFKKATRDPFDKITDYLFKGGKGGSVAREKPPTEPKTIGFMGRTEEDL